jgi:small-conductance mechanosensitive channel
LIDQQPLRSARALLSLANTADEQQLAFQAIRIADDEVDQAFAAALLGAQQHPPAQSKGSRAISARIQALQVKVQSDQQEVQRLEALVASPKRNDHGAIQEQLELAKAQLDLDQDDLGDARQDLVRSGDDAVALIQELLKEHESVEHGNSNSPAPQIKPVSFHVAGVTLGSHVEDWWQLHAKENKLTEARLQAAKAIVVLAKKKELQEQEALRIVPHGPTSGVQQPKRPETPALTIKDLKARAENERTLATYDKRILDLQALDRLYGAWLSVVANQVRVVWHAILGSVLLILVIALGVGVALRLVNTIYGERGVQNRRLLTTRVAYRSAIHAIGVVLVLLALFGIPNQISTVLALAGAGLTVALKDFIVGFFGWFTLMGRNGIRVGDWVEINGIGGEVIEIGLLRTVLLETGNWNDAGHPTGRKVAFVNSFAIEGHYFNFTTSGQWMWDEIDVPIPAGEDPHAVTEAIRKIVGDETAPYASSAEQEWQRATHDGAARSFSAAPSVDVRPTSTGMNVVVRYITQANVRHDLRSRLYQALVALLYGKGTSQSSSVKNAVTELG